MNYLFICGCPRSGTTALWKTVTGHKEVAIGVERYIKKSIPKFKLTSKDFQKENFFTYKEGQTHFPDLTSAGYGKYYEELAPRYEDCKYFGDKTPQLYTQYEGIFSAFPEAKVLFIFRNIYDVAQSYINRKNNPKDGWQKDHKKAVEEWNESLKATLTALKKGRDILSIEYEPFFYDDDFQGELFNYLDLKTNLQYRINFKNVKIMANRIGNKRQNLLNEEERAYIDKYANFDAYQQLQEVFQSSKMEKA